MTLYAEDQNEIRQYLLGKLIGEVRQRVEERLLTEEDFLGELLIGEDELIRQYLNDDLSVEDHLKFERHFLSTPERIQKLRLARALSGETSEKSDTTLHKLKGARRPLGWRGPLTSPNVRVAAALVVLLGLALGSWRLFFHRSDLEMGLIALNTAYSERRPLEARISGLSYAPPSTVRGMQERVDSLARDRAERLLLDAATERPEPDAQHALGKLYLAEGKLDQAVEQFEKALQGDSKNAQLHNDLGVALLERSQAKNSDENRRKFNDLDGSLEHLDAALKLNGSLIEALFNRGLVHRQLLLPRQAEEDWKQYLEHDSSSEWANEASENLKLLQARKDSSSQSREQVLKDFLGAYRAGDDESAWMLVSENREALSRRLVSEQLLAAYFEHTAKGETSDAVSMLDGLRYVGELEAQRKGEHFNAGLAKFYAQLPPNKLSTLAQAQELIRRGHDSYSHAKFDAAINAYAKAKQLFFDSGDTWEAMTCEFWIGYCYLASGDTQRSLASLKPLARACDREGFKWLMMRALLIVSSGLFNLNEYSKAIETCNRSLGLAEQLGDTVGTFNALSILVEYYRYIGNYDQSVECVRRSLQYIESCPLNQIQVWRHYSIIASSLNSSGLRATAVEYQREALRLALAAGETSMVCVSYSHLGAIYGGVRNFDAAVQNAHLAFVIAQNHAGEAVGKQMMAYASLQLGHIYRLMGKLDESVESYDRSIEIYKNLNFPTHLYQAYKGRMLCHVASGNDRLAEQDIETALGLVEKYRTTILEDENRNNFFNVEQNVFDVATDFEHTRHNDPQKALYYSESSRARSLLDMIASAEHASPLKEQTPDQAKVPSTPLSLPTIQQHLPEHVQIIEYAVLKDKLLVWLITKTGFYASDVQITEEDLRSKVQDYVQELSTARDSGSPALLKGKALFDLLIKPVEASLENGGQIVVVPDKALNYLPFGALVSTTSDRFLIEDYLFSYSPSSTVFITSSDKASRATGVIAERLLSVGNPSFDKVTYPNLADLPSAVIEAEAVARFYQPALLLTGGNAAKRAVSDAMANSDVVHLALHSIIDDRQPMKSKLMLAKARNETVEDGDAGGELEAGEIYRLKLPRTRLVVLSSCQSGVGRYYDGEGVSSIARPFLSRGVPLVVASLWPVDSSPTSELMINFHRYRAKGRLATAEALRRAQLDMIHGDRGKYRDPYFWAPFILIGGYAIF